MNRLMFLSLAFVAINAFADCSDVCRNESDALKKKYADCANELPADRGACYAEATPLTSAVQTCMRVCNTKGAAEVERMRKEAKSPKPQP